MNKILFVTLMFFAKSSFADLATSMNCYENTKTESCKFLLIGAVDAVSANNKYCPDGHTSYGFLIDAWERDLKVHPERKSLSSYESMRLTIQSLGLSCK